jgi:hypothetical protein
VILVNFGNPEVREFHQGSEGIFLDFSCFGGG